MENEFINSLEPRLIIDYLYEYEVISKDEHTSLNDEDKPQHIRRRHLLDYITTRGDKKFSKFKQAIGNIRELSELSKELEHVDYSNFKQVHSRKQEPTDLSGKRKESTPKLARKRRKRRRKEISQLPESEDYKTMRRELKTLLKSGPVTVSSVRKPIKYVEREFNKLADMYNYGQMREFSVQCIRIKEEMPDSDDLSFTVKYMQVLFAQLKLDHTIESICLAEAKALVPKTSDVMYSQLLVLSPQTRKSLLHRQFGKLQEQLDESKAIIQSNPMHFTGRAAGWVYYNEGRAKALQLDAFRCIGESSDVYVERMREQIMKSFTLSLQHFSYEQGQDRIYGSAAVKFQLVVLLYQCGFNGLEMDRNLKISRKNQETADFIMEQYEGSNTLSCPILEMYFRIANCDRLFRKSLRHDALKNAKRALELAEENMTEFVQPVQNRIDYLRRHTIQIETLPVPETESSNESSS